MSSAFVYNVTYHSPVGLTIPCREPHRTEPVQCIVDSECYGITSIGVDAIQNITYSVDSFVHTADSRLEHLCVHGRSQFAEVYPSVMLIPSESSSTSFQLITDVVEPSEYCADGTIAAAQFAHPISFHTRVSLIPNAERPA